VRIERVDLFVVPLPLIRPFETSSSRKDFLEHILVKAYAEGLVGWGEVACSSGPFYNEETTGTCWHILEGFLIPAVLGRPWAQIEELVACYRRVKRNHFAKAGLEMAGWDLLAQAQKQPLARLLGGTRTEILSGVSLGIEANVERLLTLVEQYVGEGYRRIKCKVAPGRDLEVLRRVRERFPTVPVMADANSAYTLADGPMLRAFDDLELLMIEQPLAEDDLVDHAALQRTLRTPLCLDESILSAEHARKALDLGSCRIINIKVSRLGGLLEARRVHDLCHAQGVPVWCGGMHEYGIGRAANVALAALPGFSLPGDVSGSDKYYREDIVEPPVRAVNGAIAVPSAPGLGYLPDEERIRRWATRSCVLSQ
jgi:O-succinylbenzoate synthase